MKKIIAILASFAFVGAASAVSVTVESQFQNGDNGASNSHNYAIGISEAISDRVAVDLGVTQYVTDVTEGLSTRAEVGGTYKVSVPYSTLYTRVALGDRFTGSSDYGYYSAETGLLIPVGLGFTARVGYRYRTAFDKTIGDKTNTVRAGLGYAVTKKDTVGVSYDQVRGDSQSHSYNLYYTRNF